MNTYLVAICDDGELYIRSCQAHSMKNAKEKFTEQLIEYFPDLNSDSWDDILTELCEHNVIVGDIYDLSEFEC